MFIAEKLKMARNISGYTQQEVADILGIDRTSYTYYECGRSIPTTDQLVQFAALFKVNIDWFIKSHNNTGVLCEPEDIFESKKIVAEGGFFDLTQSERELVGIFRSAQSVADERNILRAVKSADIDKNRDGF